MKKYKQNNNNNNNNNVHKGNKIHIFTDLHGHSQKNNTFIYGSLKAKDEGMLSWTKIQLIPRIFAKICPYFSSKDCRFRAEETKTNIARISAWGEFKISNSFTLETSYYGYVDKKQSSNNNLEEPEKIIHFTEIDYEKIGGDLC